MSKGSGGNRGNGRKPNKELIIAKIESLPKRKNGLRDSDAENPIPYAGADMMEETIFNQNRWINNDIGIKTIDIDRLETIQPAVNKNTLKHKFNNSESLSLIKVVHIKGRYIIQDGNHTAVIELLKGKKKIQVKVYEFQ